MRKTGQTISEALIALPIFFALAFAALQLAQLGVAVVIANYGASSIARKAAAEENGTFQSGSPNLSAYEQKARDLMVAGMLFQDLEGCVQTDTITPTAELTVRLRTKVYAFPFFGNLVSGAFGPQHADEGKGTCPSSGSALDSPTAVGPFNFSASAPYYFYVNGKAEVRLNYRV